MSSEFQLFCTAKCKNGEQCTGKALEKYEYKLCDKHKKYSKEVKKSETRKVISKKDRLDVWNFYVGDVYGLHQCLLCCAKILDKGSSEWHCGHVISHANGGSSSVSNLRPICADCNYAMGKTDMKVYIEERYCIKDRSAVARLQLTGEPLLSRSVVSTDFVDSKKRTRRGKYKVDTSVLDKKLEEKKTKLEDIKEEIKKIGRKKDNLEIVERKRKERELLKREIAETKKVIRKTKSTRVFVKETIAINQQTDADIKEAEIHSLFHADILSLKEFKVLTENKSRTLDEQLSIDRYLFCETFGKSGEENIEFFKDLWGKKSTFKNLLRVNNTTFAKLLNEQEGRKGMIIDSQDRIHQKFTEEKLFIVLSILDGLYGDRITQFTDPDIKVSKAKSIENVKEDLKRYQESLKAYFGIKYNASEPNDAIAFRTMNRILKSVIGMTMKSCGKGKMQLKADGLDVFHKYNVKLVVEKVEDLITPYLKNRSRHNS